MTQIYDEYKHDYFPGEEVTVFIENVDEYDGVIREKAKFPMIRGADGSVQREAFSRYFVRSNLRPNEEALLDDKHLRRDRKVFTKQNLRSFLKNSLQRESWTGAPWLVKENLAMQYRLPMDIPAHLLQNAVFLANKQHMLQAGKPKGTKVAHRAKNLSPQELANEQHLAGMQQQNGAHQRPPHQMQQQAPRPQVVIPPPIKYPVEDTDIQPEIHRTRGPGGGVRPPLSFQTEEQARYVQSNRTEPIEGVSMESMGMLLEAYVTLNVQSEVLVLDTFTFDDFMDAMHYSQDDIPCELLNEVHCSLLKQIVDAKGQVQVKLPALPDESDEESDSQPDESQEPTPIPDLPDAPARSTRSRLSHVEIAADMKSPSVPPEKAHCAGEMASDWIQKLAARDFVHGGWQTILVGFLWQLSHDSRNKDRCLDILADLAPAGSEPVRETAREQYNFLSVNKRVRALEMILYEFSRTKALKDYLDTCSDDQTEVRKKKTDLQRQRKDCIAELNAKDRERKIAAPNFMENQAAQANAELDTTTGDIDDTIETNGTAGSDDLDEDAPTSGRALRRGNDRKRKRESEAAKAEKEKQAKLDTATKAKNKERRAFQKLCDDVEELRERVQDFEDQIKELDDDLRELNVQRTKVLGLDRYCNRYYFFERNGQPYGGLPDSSTSHYGYSNARLWVQGPDPMEIEGLINLPPDQQAEYKRRFGVTVPERRTFEEGATVLANATEWGYYDSPAELDALIDYLDDRGLREKKLKKDLMEWRDTIAEYMQKRQQFFDEEARRKDEADEEAAHRVSTRNKVKEEEVASGDRCLRWRNATARTELGHAHSEPKAKKEKKSRGSGKGVAQAVTRKPSTRRG